MSNIEVIRRYFEKFFSGKARHSEVREFLTDDFSLRNPLMSADSADEYVEQLRSFGDELEMHADVRHLIADGDLLAAHVDFQGPTGIITYAEWFTMRDGKIAHLEVVYDPRPYLAGSSNA